MTIATKTRMSFVAVLIFLVAACGSSDEPTVEGWFDQHSDTWDEILEIVEETMPA